MPLDPPLGPTDHAAGPSDAAITLVQYGDLECPYSKDVQAVVQDVRTRFPDRIRLVFRHFPLRYHPNALRAAIAAEEAGRQGAFWPFHDRLFDHQLKLRADQLVGHAEALGLDARAMQIALDNETSKAEILAQKKAGVHAGVGSTLNLWINGSLYEEEDLETALVTHVIQPLKAAG
ncbi:MAG: thioredoxin domain-containing protein [Bacteroidota bacterium]